MAAPQEALQTKPQNKQNPTSMLPKCCSKKALAERAPRARVEEVYLFQACADLVEHCGFAGKHASMVQSAGIDVGIVSWLRSTCKRTPKIQETFHTDLNSAKASGKHPLDEQKRLPQTLPMCRTPLRPPAKGDGFGRGQAAEHRQARRQGGGGGRVPLAAASRDTSHVSGASNRSIWGPGSRRHPLNLTLSAHLERPTQTPETCAKHAPEQSHSTRPTSLRHFEQRWRIGFWATPGEPLACDVVGLREARASPDFPGFERRP